MLIQEIMKCKTKTVIKYLNFTLIITSPCFVQKHHLSHLQSRPGFPKLFSNPPFSEFKKAIAP